mgnify:CR=1 FL=1
MPKLTKAICKLCGNEAVAMDLCAKHYMRMKRHGDPSFTKRPIDWGTRTHIVKRRLDIQRDVYLELFEKQGGACAICKNPETTQFKNGQFARLAIDHNHETGAIRGLLCGGCNRAIGGMHDNPATLREAADYLKHHGSENRTPIIDHGPQEPKLCSVDNCNGVHSGNGFCSKHNKQYGAGQDPHENAAKTCRHCGVSLANKRPHGAYYCSLSCKSKHYREVNLESSREKPLCAKDGCNLVSQRRGLCRKHFMEKWHSEKSEEQDEAIRQKISDAQLGIKRGPRDKPNSEAMRAKISQHWEKGNYDALKGRKHTQESKDKMSKPILETTTGTAFTSLTNAGEYYHIPHGTIRRTIATGKPILKGVNRGLMFVRLDSIDGQANVNPNLKGERYAPPDVAYVGCSVEGCNGSYAARGFCLNHYKQFKKTCARQPQ